MAENKISEMIKSSLEGIKTVADTGTIIGNPITTNNGTVVIPVSKVTIGIASGGFDYASKKGEKEAKPSNGTNNPCFGGGGGTGVSVTPMGFLVVKEDGSVSMLNVANPAATPMPVGVIDSITNLADKTPDIVERFKKLFEKKKPERGLDDEALKRQIDADEVENG